jgi:Ca-activated chloride channel homolog
MVQAQSVGKSMIRRHRPFPRPRPRPLPPPVLMIRQQKRSVPLKLAQLDVNTTIVGHLAETTMTMKFYNPNNRAHEGDLYFPLAQGATISGYALDVKGQMVDGVVIDKDRGRQVFETEVRKGIDPGLIEWTKGRNFKTRVFPIPARGTRTIRVTYVADIDQTANGAIYRLPLAFKKKIGSFSIRVEVIKAASKPLVKSGGPKGLAFRTWRDSYIASSKLKNVILKKDLRIALPKIETQPIRVEKAADGNFYFTIHDAPKTIGGQAPPSPSNIALYWDASLSRKTASHEKELKLFTTYLNQLTAPVSISVVTFRNVSDRVKKYRLPAQRKALLKALRTVQYDGGTQVGSIGKLRGKYDLVLFFSDGLSNFGVEKPPALGAPIYTINSSKSANHAFMRYLALRSGGAYLNLARISIKGALSSIGTETYSFISAKAAGCTTCELYPQVRVPIQGNFTLTGRLTKAVTTVTLNYGLGSRVMHSRTFTIKQSDARNGGLLRRAWAQKKLDELLIFPERNRGSIATLGKEFSLVTPMTSLIVLELFSQYVEHKIRPPATLPGMANKYDKAMKTLAMVKKKKEASKLAHVLNLWNQRKTWYKTKFKKWHKIRKYKKNKSSGRSRSPMSRRRRSPRESITQTLGSGGGSGLGGLGIGRGGIRGTNPRASSGAVAKKKTKIIRPQASITLKAWDPKTPYLKAIKAAAKSRRYQVYLAQRAKHGKAPAFYLDCANFFRKKKQNRLALRILSNLAELELENPALLRVLAHRLNQISELDLSIIMFKKILSLRPEEPQSFRDLALVLERRADKNRRLASKRGRVKGDYEQALSLLANVVMNKWSRFNEIEVIALTELNNILPKARKAGVINPPVDKRLIKKLKMDIRIVMTWDADLTDMDLHVIEPSGEEAYYSHNRTEIGGMVTRDFTQGYGPEVYAIRRAMRGKYQIRTKYFGSSAAKLTGAVTLQVDVYTNYGRSNQRRRSLTLRLTKSKENFLVGTIRF